MNTQKIFMIILTLGVLLTSCNESSWLKEEPLDFYSPDNSYQTSAQFRQAENNLYNNLRKIIFHNTKDNGYCHLLQVGSDMYMWGWQNQTFDNYSAYVVPTLSYFYDFWKVNYQNIVNANEIIYRLEQENKVSTEEKKVFRGEALFFRAMAYRYLGHTFGGVPLELEHRTVPRKNYVRATREQVYEQCRVDLEEAITLLPDISGVEDGKVTKQAAQHLISEIYISLGKYVEAISVATEVINHPSMALMTERFGVRKDEPYDVYWDLFRNGNINRSSGNTEAILVMQYEYNNSGSPDPDFRMANFLPQYRSVQVEAADGNGTVAAFSPQITAEKGGRGQGGIAMTSYLENELWKSDWDNDIRNASYNIIRDVLIDNPKAKGFGEYLVKDGWLREQDGIMNFFPIMWKVTGNFPEAVYRTGKFSAFGEHELINSGSSSQVSYRDEYCFRLAETYLLRAEAYLNNGDKTKAVADINVIRARAHATPISEAEISLDYILDERARELATEEYRNLTLMRLGKLVERSKKYNPNAHLMGDWQNLWPIPYSEIERNVEAVLEQNPGYY